MYLLYYAGYLPGQTPFLQEEPMKFILMHPELAGLTPEDFGYDYTQRVPVLSIFAMILSIILAVAVPVVIILYVKKRYKLDSQVIIYGLLSYMAGAYLLPYLFYIGMQYIDSATGFFSANELIYSILMSVITAGLELAALFIGLRMAHKRTPLTLGNIITFAVIFCVFPLLTQTISNLGNYLSVSITVNQGGLRDAVANMIESGESTREDVDGLLTAMTSLFTENFFYYIFMALDVLLLLFMRAGLCVFLGGSILGILPKPQKYFSLLIAGLYAATMLLRYCGLVESYVIAELLYFLLAVISMLLAYRAVAQFMPEDLKRLLGKPDPSLNPKNNKPGNNTGHKMPKIVMPKD